MKIYGQHPVSELYEQYVQYTVLGGKEQSLSATAGARLESTLFISLKSSPYVYLLP
jgi:hypothetical protein